jgi:hypothetical protein
MGFPTLERRHSAALLFGALLFVLGLSMSGFVVSYVAQPLMVATQRSANDFLSVTAAVINVVSVGIVYLLLLRARSLGRSRPASIWARNSETLSAGVLVALVYLILIPVNLFVAELRSFFQVTFGNLLQINTASGAGRALVMFGLPIVGIALVLLFGPKATQRLNRAES